MEGRAKIGWTLRAGARRNGLRRAILLRHREPVIDQIRHPRAGLLAGFESIATLLCGIQALLSMSIQGQRVQFGA